MTRRLGWVCSPREAPPCLKPVFTSFLMSSSQYYYYYYQKCQAQSQFLPQGRLTIFPDAHSKLPLHLQGTCLPTGFISFDIIHPFRLAGRMQTRTPAHSANASNTHPAGEAFYSVQTISREKNAHIGCQRNPLPSKRSTTGGHGTLLLPETFMLAGRQFYRAFPRWP